MVRSGVVMDSLADKILILKSSIFNQIQRTKERVVSLTNDLDNPTIDAIKPIDARASAFAKALHSLDSLAARRRVRHRHRPP